MTINTQILLTLGTEWKKSQLHRIYFNNIEELAELEISRYKTGNVSCGTYRGESISNVKLRTLSNACQNTKIYYDLAAKKFEFDARYGSEEIANFVIAKLTQLATIAVPAPKKNKTVKIKFTTTTHSNKTAAIYHYEAAQRYNFVLCGVYNDGVQLDTEITDNSINFSEYYNKSIPKKLAQSINNRSARLSENQTLKIELS